MINQVNILKSKQLDFGLAELRSDNVLTFEPNENFNKYTVPVLEIMLTTFNEITEGKPRPYYCDNRKVDARLSGDEKQFVINHFHEFATSFAMSEDSPITRFAFHTIMYIYKPTLPMKMFKNKEESINWLKSLN